MSREPFQLPCPLTRIRKKNHETREMSGWKKRCARRRNGSGARGVKYTQGWSWLDLGPRTRSPHGPSVNPRGHVTSIFGCISPKHTANQRIIQQGVVRGMLIRHRSSNEWRSIEIRTLIRVFIFLDRTFHSTRFIYFGLRRLECLDTESNSNVICIFII